MVDIFEAAQAAGLSLIVAQIAVILADVDGRERALAFVESCRIDDEGRALDPIKGRAVPVRPSVRTALD
jgi:hypothetical protein